MPAGLGIYDGGRSTAAEERVLAKIAAHAAGAEQLTKMSTTAVEQMTAAGALRSKDITKPFSFALPSNGTRGGTARLRYSASDDSMWSRISVRVTTASGASVGHAAVPMRALQPQRVETLSWHVPRSASARLRFCVVAIDGAGNRSAPACAPLRVQ
jgi:hypothetical protein